MLCYVGHLSWLSFNSCFCWLMNLVFLENHVIWLKHVQGLIDLYEVNLTRLKIVSFIYSQIWNSAYNFPPFENLKLLCVALWFSCALSTWTWFLYFNLKRVILWSCSVWLYVPKFHVWSLLGSFLEEVSVYVLLENQLLICRCYHVSWWFSMLSIPGQASYWVRGITGFIGIIGCFTRFSLKNIYYL